MIMNAFWMLDNQQIFKNTWQYKDRVDKEMLSGHFLMTMSMNGVSQSTPLLYIAMFMIFAALYTIFISDRYKMKINDFNIWEELPNYKDAITKD